MPSQHNLDQAADIKAKLERSQNVILTQYTGISVSDQTKLRAELKAIGGELNVAKNNLVKLNLKDRNALNDVAAAALNGPNAIIYGYQDPVSAAKVLVAFAKDHDTIQIKFGVLVGTDGQSDQLLDAAAVENLATLPGKNELLAHLVSQLNAPVSGLVTVLSGTTRSLVYVLNAIKEKKINN